MAGAACLTAACARDQVGPPRYSLNQCHTLSLIDGASGEAVRGAEDFALDREGGRLFISAYDRRAVEKAARKRRDELPHGGVYAVQLEALFRLETDRLFVTSLAAPGEFVGGLRPHGIDFDADKNELIFVNRTYERDGRKWMMNPQLQRIGANGEVFVGAPSPAHCAANDVVAKGGGILSSFTHASCGFGAGVENVFSLKRSGVGAAEDTLFDKASFANGLVILPDGDLALAATREKAILRLQYGKDGYKEAARISLPGGPDNLTIAQDGGIVAAVHPSMMKLMFNRKFGAGRAPSRIVKADPDSGMVDVLFDDPDAELFSAATVAVDLGNRLVAGSVTDEGLLICQAKS